MMRLEDLHKQYPYCEWGIGTVRDQWEIERYWDGQKPYVVHSRGLTEAQALDRALFAARVDLPVLEASV